MPSGTNIILITNDSNVEQILKPKLILLREVDNVLTTKYSDAVENIKKARPELVLLYGDEEKSTLKLIRKIKTDEEIKNTVILLITNDYNQNFILNAYDENIADYFTLQTSDAEILIRTMWCLKNKLLLTLVNKQQNLLEEVGVIDKDTGFYTNEFCEKVLEKELASLKTICSDGILMLISADEESKTKLKPIQLANAIRNSTRESDLAVHGSANRFYVLLKGTPLKGAYSVWDKIKQAVGEEYTINAGVSFIGEKSFKELKEILLKTLVEALATNQDFIIADEEKEQKSSQEWIEKINAPQKNFKLFKLAFNRKLGKVITPVFFQMQKLYEEKLFKTQIEQYSTSDKSAFVLKKGNNVSEFKITYPGFSKINIDTNHQGLDSPENKRISLDLTELSDERLTNLLEEFIQEFKVSE